jgi:hypothetical protein
MVPTLCRYYQGLSHRVRCPAIGHDDAQMLTRARRPAASSIDPA